MISAIILAAGSSKRMKLGNKLLLEKENTTIIENTLKNIKASKVNEIIVVLGKEVATFKKKINDNNIKYVTNHDYKSGISSSIKKGVKNINKKSTALIICLADMPLIKTSTYNQIITSFYKNKNKNIIPFFKKHKGNPVLFDKLYFNRLMKLNGDKGAKFLIKKNPTDFFHLAVLDKNILIDIDNDEQYYNFLKNE